MVLDRTPQLLNSSWNCSNLFLFQVLSCRMLGAAEDYVPMIHLYSTDMEGNTKLLNRELVDGGGAAWIEHSGTQVPPVSAWKLPQISAKQKSAENKTNFRWQTFMEVVAAADDHPHPKKLDRFNHKNLFLLPKDTCFKESYRRAVAFCYIVLHLCSNYFRAFLQTCPVDFLTKNCILE